MEMYREWLCMHKQSIPGHFSPPTQPRTRLDIGEQKKKKQLALTSLDSKAFKQEDGP